VEQSSIDRILLQGGVTDDDKVWSAAEMITAINWSCLFASRPTARLDSRLPGNWDGWPLCVINLPYNLQLFMTLRSLAAHHVAEL